MRSKIAEQIISDTTDEVRGNIKDHVLKINYHTSIIPIEYFYENRDFAKKVIDEYNDAKEKNSSWFGPKIPFYISKPKLITNAHTAMKSLKKKHGGYRPGSGRKKGEEKIRMWIPVSKIEQVKKIISK